MHVRSYDPDDTFLQSLSRPKFPERRMDKTYLRDEHVSHSDVHVELEEPEVNAMCGFSGEAK
jgi:hypothetical protein